MTTSRGVPTHAVLGFTRMLLKTLREQDPTHVALCFDKQSREDQRKRERGSSEARSTSSAWAA